MVFIAQKPLTALYRSGEEVGVGATRTEFSKIIVFGDPRRGVDIGVQTVDDSEVSEDPFEKEELAE